ncbi:MAG TPA: hypothetical protein DCS88_04710, partial [Alphaproteobacteria bacterium]|nr:hypothetical protein [Alphaproteobacteria bacterium]
MTDHDAIYHRLFSHPEMVADLLHHFLDPALVSSLDCSRMKRMNTKFTAQSGERRRGDIVWEIPTNHGDSVYVLLILEFQSGIDEWMVLRLNVYCGLLYQQLVDERQLKGTDGLPPILPIVLYNGKPRWNAASSLQEVIRLPEHSTLWKYQPQLRYHVVDEGRFPEETLKKRDSLMAIFMRMECPADIQSLTAACEDLVTWFATHPDGPPLKGLFRELIITNLERLGKVDSTRILPEELEEVVAMCSYDIRDLIKDHVDKVTAGIAEDMKRQAAADMKRQVAADVERQVADMKRQVAADMERQGELKGKIQILLKMMQRRFGTLPDWVDQKITQADSASLDEWGLNMMDAQSLDTVFSG